MRKYRDVKLSTELAIEEEDDEILTDDMASAGELMDTQLTEETAEGETEEEAAADDSEIIIQ